MTLRIVASAACLAACAAVALAGCASGGRAAAVHTSKPARSAPATHSATPSPFPSPSRHRQTPLAVAPGAGLLHQTMVKPRASGPAFRAMTTDLWLAVRAGQPRLALQAFFPLAAYKQVKAEADPAYDWQTRLWADFAVDVKAAHALLGRGAKSASLIRVVVPPGAQWISPGGCYNKLGYWHVGQSRVVYREHGQVRSFGIASLISWRGIWYVVHFGGVTRPVVGMVDDPAIGPGVAGPPSGC